MLAAGYIIVGERFKLWLRVVSIILGLGSG
jgi:hypothetical protein